MAQGCDSPLATTLTRILCCSAVSKTQGPSPNGGTGTPMGRSSCAWLGASIQSNSGAAERTQCRILMRTSRVIGTRIDKLPLSADQAPATIA